VVGRSSRRTQESYQRQQRFDAVEAIIDQKARRAVRVALCSSSLGILSLAKADFLDLPSIPEANHTIDRGSARCLAQSCSFSVENIFSPGISAGSFGSLAHQIRHKKSSRMARRNRSILLP
jgi:hypothetical protein